MKWIALLRGINVGGNNILPMAELRELLPGLGYENVKTYIQSGNCLFDCKETDANIISDQISGAIGARFEFRPQIMTVTADRIEKALLNNPFPQAVDNPKSLYMFFMTEAPENVDEELLGSIQKDGEDSLILIMSFISTLRAEYGNPKSEGG